MQTISFSCLVYDDGRSGISEYIHSVLIRLLCNHRVVVHILEKDQNILREKIGSHENLEYRIYGRRLEKPVLNLLYHSFILPFKIKKDKADLIYLPAANRRLMLFYPQHTIGIIHDLAEIVLPQKFGFLRWLRVKFFMRLFIRKLPKIVAVSKQTKADIVTHYKIPENKISVVYNGIKKFPDSEKPYSPAGENKYILYVSRIEHPGKNHIRLIEAYEKLCEEDPSFDLILAGNLKERHEEVIEKIENSNFKNRIHLTGFITDEELGELYKKASLYVCASLYEGFGFTPVEAMSYGIPVISSDKGSLLEVCGDAVIYFDPYSVEEIFHAMQKSISDTNVRKSLIEKGLERVKSFNWDKHIVEVLKR